MNFSHKETIHKEFKDKLVVFVGLDFFRGLGLEKFLPNYLIISGRSCEKLDEALANGHNIFSLPENNINEIHNTGKILENTDVQSHITETQKKLNCSEVLILAFKGTFKNEFICKKLGWKYINLDHKLSEKLENKANFQEFLKNYSQPQLQTITGKLKDIDPLPLGPLLVLQFARGFAGSSTQFIGVKEFYKLQSERPEEKIKLTRQVNGPTLTLNGCIYNNKVLLGPPMIQKTGDKRMSRYDGGSCGLLFKASDHTSKNIIQKTISAGQELGNIFKEQGLRGFFGLDLIAEGSDVYPIEINPRLTASVHPFTSWQIHKELLPFLLLHLLEFAGVSVDLENPDAYLEEFPGETVIFRNVTDEPFTLEKKPATTYSYLKLLEKGEPTGYIKFSNGSIIDPDNRWGELWSTGKTT